MKPDEIRHLLGGYATGTLTPEEQRLLFEAALEDQELFESLADEQALKETLDDPRVRHELRSALEPRPSLWQRLTTRARWLYPVAGAGALAAAALTVVVMVRETPRRAEVAFAPALSPAPAPVREPVKLEPEVVTAQKPVVRAKPDLRRKPEPEKPAGVPPSDPVPAATTIRPQAGGVVGGVIAPPVAMAEAPAPPPPPPAPAQADSGRAAPAAAMASADLPREARTAADTTPGARELYYQPGKGPAAALSGRLAAPGFRAESAKAGVPASSPGAVGFRYTARRSATGAVLNVESNVDSTLYLFRRAAPGDWIPVTPGGLALRARTPVTAPSIEIESSAPAPQALAVVFRSPAAALAQSGSALTAAVERIRRETPAATAENSGGATYTVSAGPGPLVIPIRLP